MKKNLAGLGLAIAFLAICSLGNAQTPPVAKPAKSKHALVMIVSLPVTAVAHPKRTAKQLLGSVLFAVETGVDGARVGLEGADKVFDVLSLQGKFPLLDAIYAGVSVGAKDAAKLDAHLEKWETELFGTHN